MAGNCCLSREFLTILPSTPDFTLITHDPVCRAISRRKGPHLIGVLRTVLLWKKDIHVLSEHLGRAIAEGPLRSPVE